MSDRLDDDALLLILDELATPSSNYDVYCITKTALRNVCLASHRLRRLAHPRLFRQIWVVEQSQADKLKSSPAVSSLGQGTRWYTVGKLAYEDSLPEAVDMAHVLLDVEKLWMTGPWTPGNLARIESFSKLRHLSLFDAELGGSSMVCTAPFLEELTINQSFLSGDGAAEWIQPLHLPALRILSVVGVGESSMLRRFELIKVLGPALLAQLDVLQTVRSNLEIQSKMALGTAPPVLFLVQPLDNEILPQHSLFMMLDGEEVPSVASTVRYVARRLESAMSSSAGAHGPRVVVLPRRVLSLVERDRDVGDAVRRLEQVCGRDVHIIWSGMKSEDLLAGGISREFVQHVRELKAAARTASALEA
ncbi:hypothetical protein JCM9279_004990 [Rhodotorula babjevae]